MMNNMYRIWRSMILICCCSIGSIQAQVTLPRFISDGMILQRNVSIPVWGWASPGETVTVQFNGKTYTTVTGSNKKWKLQLDKAKEGGPYTMEISAANHITLTDILVGDVWICSGQSNMDFRMYQAKDKYAGEIAQASNPYIRQYLVDKKYNFPGPWDNVGSRSTGWKPVTPENVLQFTAVGYFFAKSVYEKYKVPIGLLHTSWGGTPAEAWVSEETIQQFPDYYKRLQELKDTAQVRRTIEKENSQKNNWYNSLNNADAGLRDKEHPWYAPTVDAGGWKDFTVPGFWEDQGVKNMDGVIWFRKEINVPASWAGKPATLYLGFIADEDTTYVNGIKVGAVGSRYNPRKYELPAGMLKPGNNVIAVRVLNKWGPGGFITEKIYKLASGTEEIDLRGAWKYKVGAVAPNALPGNTNFHYMPTGLYNAMVAPLIPYAIKGVIWYQGEANTAKAKEYQALFPALINDWRKHWGAGDFPFLFVQLANYLAVKKEPGESEWAELREAQLMTLSVKNTGMAVISDIGEWNDVHPLNKEDVGKRLALAAEKVAYGEKKIVYSSPLYKSMKVTGNKVTLSFELFGSQLVAKGADTLRYFSIAGPDKKFVWAHAVIKGDKVEVWSGAVPQPVAVRYAWADNPEGANLYNKEGLPASSFRTDR